MWLNANTAADCVTVTEISCHDLDFTSASVGSELDRLLSQANIAPSVIVSANFGAPKATNTWSFVAKQRDEMAQLLCSVMYDVSASASPSIRQSQQI